MANTYKNIVVTPNRSTAANVVPSIQFSGGDATTNTDISLKVYTTSNGTLSFDGSAGQLFSITNDLSNVIFSVNDVSGIPSIEVDANGRVSLAQFSGNVGIGTSSPSFKLDVSGDMRVTGNVILGDASTDTITLNGSVITLGNNQSFDGGTLFIDAVNNEVGIGITNPTSNLHVIGTANITGPLLVLGSNVTQAFISGNAYATAVGTAGNTFASSVGVSANIFATSIGASSNAWANTKVSSSGGTITGDLSITGNLNVSGNTSYINVTNFEVDDPLIYLAGNNYVSDIVDIGFIANYVNATGANVHTGLYREHADKMYYLFQGYDKEPANNHIGALSNNMTLAVLNADVKTSNLTLFGSNAQQFIISAFDKANSTTYTSNVVISVSDNSNAALRITQTGTGEALRVEDSSNPDATSFVVDANGDVKISTTVPGKLAFSSADAGKTLLYAASPGSNWYFDFNGTGTSYLGSNTFIIRDGKANAEYARIDTSGNVLIGRTTSTIGQNVKLDVAGGVNSSILLVNGVEVTSIANSYATAVGTAGNTYTLAAFNRANNAQLTSDNANNLGGIAAANYLRTDIDGTLTGNLSISKGADNILLTNGTSNWIYWTDAGATAPTFTTRSTGTKLVLYPAISGVQVDYAMGIEPATLWSSVPVASDSFGFKWYGGTTQAASLTGAGNLTLPGSVNASSVLTSSLNISGTPLAVSSGGTGQNTASAAANALDGYLTITSAAGTTTLDSSSPRNILVTGSLAQTIQLPDVTTLQLGWSFIITNASTSAVTMQSSGGNSFGNTISSGMVARLVCVAVTGTTTGSWVLTFIGSTNRTGTGGLVFASSPAISTLNGGTTASATLTLQSTSGVGTTDAIILRTASQSERMRIDTTGNVLIGRTTSTVGQNVKLDVNGAINASAVIVNNDLSVSGNITTVGSFTVSTDEITVGSGASNTFISNTRIVTQNIILGTGNVLIGRTDSTVGQNVRLDVAGAINASAVLVNGTPLSGGGGGASVYSANVGNNSANTFTINHALNKSFVVPAVRENATGYYAYPDIRFVDANNIVLEFIDPPTTNAYVVIVLG